MNNKDKYIHLYVNLYRICKNAWFIHTVHLNISSIIVRR